MAAHQEAERLRADMERQRKALTATSGEWEREFRLRPLTIPQGVSRAAGVRFWTSAAAAPGSGLVEALLAAHWEERDGSREDAAQWRAAALERGRALLPLWTGLSRTCLAQGEPRMALALAAWGVACAPKNVAALTTLGAACLQTGEPQAAERILRQAEQRFIEPRGRAFEKVRRQKADAQTALVMPHNRYNSFGCDGL